MNNKVNVIGAGLAGCEAAWALANRGVKVTLFEMKPTKKYRGNFGRVITSYVSDKLKDRDDIDKKRIFVTHTKCDKEIVDSVIEAVKEIAPYFEEVIETTAGCTITTHCGPNTLGVLYVRK